MISRGLRGAELPLLKVLFMPGAQPPKFLNQSCLSKHIDLASDVLYGIAKMDFLTTVWLLRSLWMLAIYYITIRLNYHVSIFKNMGVAAKGPHPLSDIALRAPLAKIFRNHLCCDATIHSFPLE